MSRYKGIALGRPVEPFVPGEHKDEIHYLQPNYVYKNYQKPKMENESFAEEAIELFG